jgi:hypothetical protein
MIHVDYAMLRRMPDTCLPVDAARGDARHRDVRAQVFAAVPQRRAPLGKRLFWRLALGLARLPMGVRLLRRLRGS